MVIVAWFPNFCWYCRSITSSAHPLVDQDYALILRELSYFCINHGEQRVFSIWNHHRPLNVLVIIFASFEYKYYGSTTIIHISPFQCGELLIRQNLTSTDVRLWRIKSTPAPKGLILPFFRPNIKYVNTALFENIWCKWQKYQHVLTFSIVLLCYAIACMALVNCFKVNLVC